MLAVTLLGAGVAIGVYTGARVELVARWRLERMETTRVANLSGAGIAKLTGRVRPRGDTLLAPISGKQCVFYCVRVVALNEDGQVSIRDSARATALAPFEVCDDTDVVEIDANSASFYLRDGERWSFGELTWAQVDRLAEDTGIEPDQLVNRDVVESLLPVDAVVTILVDSGRSRSASRGREEIEAAGPYRNPIPEAKATLVVNQT